MAVSQRAVIHVYVLTGSVPIASVHEPQTKQKEVQIALGVNFHLH